MRRPALSPEFVCGEARERPTTTIPRGTPPKGGGRLARYQRLVFESGRADRDPSPYAPTPPTDPETGVLS